MNISLQNHDPGLVFLSDNKGLLVLHILYNDISSRFLLDTWSRYRYIIYGDFKFQNLIWRNFAVHSTSDPKQEREWFNYWYLTKPCFISVAMTVKQKKDHVVSLCLVNSICLVVLWVSIVPFWCILLYFLYI